MQFRSFRRSAKERRGFRPGSYVLLGLHAAGAGVAGGLPAGIFGVPPDQQLWRVAGPGMASVYSMIMNCGGYVWVESARAEGTPVTVGLPEVGGTGLGVAESADEEASLPKVSGGTVVILEDEAGVRELAARILRERGYRVLEAQNGAEALAGLRGGNFRADLLLTDVVVPDVGIGDLEREVHTILPDLPILYMSGYPRDDILDRGLLSRDQPFIQKPFSTEQLVKEVGRLISGS